MYPEGKNKEIYIYVQIPTDASHNTIEQAINFDGGNDDNNTDSNNDVEINIYYIQQYISPTVTKKIFIK